MAELIESALESAVEREVLEIDVEVRSECGDVLQLDLREWRSLAGECEVDRFGVGEQF